MVFSAGNGFDGVGRQRGHVAKTTLLLCLAELKQKKNKKIIQ
jgi:hypothetical protein